MQTNRCSYKGFVVGIKRRLQSKEKGCRVKRCSSLLTAMTIVVVWFSTNGLLYMVSLIYRLNQSKVYIWRKNSLAIIVTVDSETDM